ncbi:MAG: glutamine-hydrolyzing GMP synthase [Lachnospiraceae bacterium]|nr:glutamine-hydrolyzing GMP synthase [Lachnospiraceae bacterium]MDD7665375.1 glutamine-hydrolyzing GMP synthase [Lachnospiraceae bacterium]MDY4164315.1 glutamine-hydrolyzing GMP synthase [Lachnospiraceae bacterium]
MDQKEKVIVIDFGGQYNQLVARRVRECNVYCEIYSYRTDIEQIKAMNPMGIILTGGPNSVYEEGAATCSPELFNLGIPVLGLCYGAQLMMYVLGGDVQQASEREYGKTELTLDSPKSELFDDVPEKSIVWMSHNDYITKTAAGFRTIAHTANCPYAAVENSEKKLFGFQFHPEVLHSQFGSQMLKNFVIKVCGCSGDWRMEDFAERTIRQIREKVGDGKALCALSGGVDSSVAAVLMSKAIGKNLTCVFVDHGLLRKDEGDLVSKVFGPEGPYDLNFVRVDASEKFFGDLKGVTEPERKRKIIGEDFIRVFEQEAKKIGKVDYLVQGTIYPDVVESGLGGESATIKSHHNVGGLPDYVDFKEIIEPLRNLFKDEVRKVGLHLGIPEELVMRQPFPGPGLGIRIIGEVTPDKVAIVQDADAIFREEMEKAGLNKTAGQYFAALTNMRSVGVMGDERTYDYAIALRAVNTVDFMTADVVEIPYEVLKTVTNRIVNEVNHVNRVLYDITSKPPGTIEFE